MSDASKKQLKFGTAITIIVISLAYLAYLGAQESKSYFVTIKELRSMGDEGYKRNLRVAGRVQPGSIKMDGPHADFIIVEKDESRHIDDALRVVYKGSEPPPDTFKDNADALALGVYKRDGVFYANELQAKCASKYASQPQQQTSAEQPQSKTY
jgi:cytochrome c-type biogenesis protein CcmE